MITRRKLLSYSVSGAGLLVAANVLGQSAERQVEITLYRDAQTPLQGTVASCCWDSPGQDLTSNESHFYANYLNSGGNLLFARWVLVWTPNSSSSGVSLFTCDAGPSNFAQVSGAVVVNSGSSPIVDEFDITSELQSLISNSSNKFLIHQTCGDDSDGPLIYGSWIETIWG